MTDKVIENNQVVVIGEIVGEFVFSHEIFGEGFYMVDLLVPRLSDSTDLIPLMVSERLLDVERDYRGVTVMVSGQFRSYNRHEERRNKLILSVFVREVEFLENVAENEKTNYIFLDGFICKEPVYRKTPLGREIADILLAVNRPYGKSDYIPCISWGRNARFASSFQVGERCRIWGRIQSREYLKKISEDETEKRIAYEVSVSKLELTNPDELQQSADYDTMSVSEPTCLHDWRTANGDHDSCNAASSTKCES
jgi:single-stranded DNA-binding protein